MGQKRKKTNAELEAEIKFLKAGKRADTIALIGQSAFKYGAYVGMAYFGYLSVDALAGQATVATIAVKLLGDMHVSIALGWIVGICGILYGRVERSLRKDVVERLAPRHAELEKKIDARRSTSSLTKRGDTPEE